MQLERPPTELGLLVALTAVGLVGLLGFQHSLRYVGVRTAVAEAIGGLVALGLVAGYVKLTR